MEFWSLAFVFALVAFLWACWRSYSKREWVRESNLAVFISGCDTGLGNRLAAYFDSLGCDVYAGCLDPASSRHSLPESVTVVPLDICKEESVVNAVARVKKSLREKGKDLWALVNNAGVCVYGEFEWLTWNQCQKQVDVNFLGTMRLMKAFLPLLRRKKGRIITITSVNGSIAYPGLSVYCATKFALEGLHHAIRLELGQQHGIKAVLVQPGDYARLTSIMSQHEKNVDEMWNHMPEEDRREFGDFFRMYHRVTMKNYGLTSPRSFENSPLLNDMKDALLNVSPKARYISAEVQYSMLYRFLALMPFWFVDSFFEKVRGMLFQTDKDS